MTTEQTVNFSIDEDNIAIVTLSRPETANALNSQMALELKDIFYDIPKQTRVVILTGAGQRVFCAGADLKERHGMGMEDWQVQHQRYRYALQAIMDCNVPVIAAVNGAAYGGGLEIALGCDFIYAAQTAKFAMPEVGLGIMPGVGGTQHLPRALGLRRAKELLYTGRAFTADEALAWGVVNKVCTPENLLSETIACAQTIAANAPLSVKAIKRTITRSSIGTPLHEGLNLESDYYNSLLHTNDRAEGINSFSQKRRPKFSGS